MDRRIDTLIALFAIAAQASAAAFMPPLDQPIRIVNEAVRTDDGITRRFTSARRIVFRPAPDGYRAEVTLEAGAPAPDDDRTTAMFNAGMARLAGRKLVFRLDRQGRVLALEDQAAAWRAVAEGVAAQAGATAGPSGAARGRRVAAIVAALKALPEDRQREIMGSLVTKIVATDIVSEGAGSPRPVRVPAGSAFGSVQLDGIRTIRVVDQGLEAVVSAAGTVTVTGADGPATGAVMLETRRHVDPATGLLIDSEETVRVTTPDGAAATSRSTIIRVKR